MHVASDVILILILVVSRTKPEIHRTMHMAGVVQIVSTYRRSGRMERRRCCQCCSHLQAVRDRKVHGHSTEERKHDHSTAQRV